MEPVKIPNPEEKSFDPLPVVPMGEYLARLEKVEERPNNFNPGEYQYLWFWRLIHGEYDNYLIFQFTSQKLGAFQDKDTGQVKKSQARKNLEALLGGELMPDSTFDWDTQIFGNQALLSIIRETKTDGTLRNKVVSVMPLSAAGNGARPAEAVQKISPELGYLRRYEAARNTLQWTPGQIVDCIYTTVKQELPFKSLQPEDQAKVLEVMEKAAEAVDIPFEDGPLEEDELAAAGMPPVETAGAMPKSTKHKVA